MRASAWQELKQSLYRSLAEKKDERTVEILDEKYKDADVIMLQACAYYLPGDARAE